MVKIKAIVGLLGLCIAVCAGTLVWGFSTQAKVQAQAAELKATTARIEALEGSVQRLRQQALLDQAQSKARADASAQVKGSANKVKESLDANPVVLTGPDADRLREHTEAVNARIRAASSLP